MEVLTWNRSGAAGGGFVLDSTKFFNKRITRISIAVGVTSEDPSIAGEGITEISITDVKTENGTGKTWVLTIPTNYFKYNTFDIPVNLIVGQTTEIEFTTSTADPMAYVTYSVTFFCEEVVGTQFEPLRKR